VLSTCHEFSTDFAATPTVLIVGIHAASRN
jgi:hypothetical protein